MAGICSEDAFKQSLGNTAQGIATHRWADQSKEDLRASGLEADLATLSSQRK